MRSWVEASLFSQKKSWVEALEWEKELVKSGDTERKICCIEHVGRSIFVSYHLGKADGNCVQLLTYLRSVTWHTPREHCILDLSSGVKIPRFPSDSHLNCFSVGMGGASHRTWSASWQNRCASTQKWFVVQVIQKGEHPPISPAYSTS